MMEKIQMKKLILFILLVCTDTSRAWTFRFLSDFGAYVSDKVINCATKRLQ